MILKQRPFVSSRERPPASAGLSNYPTSVSSPIQPLEIPKGRTVLATSRKPKSSLQDIDIISSSGGLYHKNKSKQELVEKIGYPRSPSHLTKKSSTTELFVKSELPDIIPSSSGPFSSRYIDPVLPPPDTPKLLERPVQCPQEWIDHCQDAQMVGYNKKKLQALDENGRRQITLQFIERNKDKMWKYDKKFLNKENEEICNIICNERNFPSILSKYSATERIMKLGISSDNYNSCFDQQNQSSIYEPQMDPYIHSLQTSRDQKAEKMKQLFAPALLQHGTGNLRGDNHTTEFGNFSRFNGHLKKNEMAMLNR